MQLNKHDINAIAGHRATKSKPLMFIAWISAALLVTGWLVSIEITPDIGVPLAASGLFGYTVGLCLVVRKQRKLADDLWQEYINDNAVLSQVRDIIESEEKGGSVIRDSQLARQ